MRGKAETCGYTMKCRCSLDVDFTDVIIRDVLIAGIADMDIRREILGTDSILARSTNDVVSLVESKEMARNALPSTTASVSNKKSSPTEEQPNRNQSGTCPVCKKKFALFSEGARGWNTRAHRQCIECHRAQRKKVKTPKEEPENSSLSEVSAIITQISSVAPVVDPPRLRTDSSTVDHP